jgi:hypothetical protein
MVVGNGRKSLDFGTRTKRTVHGVLHLMLLCGVDSKVVDWCIFEIFN